MSIVWKPSQPQNSQMWQFMRFVEKSQACTLKDYPSLYRWSIENTPLFWKSLCDFYHISFHTAPKTILENEDDMMQARWFQGASFNFAEKLLSRRDAHPAIISIHENGKRSVLSYEALYKQVAACALGLKQAGVTASDRVAGILPNISQTVIAMLATTSLGAIWSSCSPDFGAEAALDRLSQIHPKVLFACDGYQYAGKTHFEYEKIQAIAKGIPSLTKIVLVPNLDSKRSLPADISWWDDFLQTAEDCDFQAYPFDHPVYILFSSGTTGKPKCIVHGAGGTLLQHIKELGLHSDIKPEDKLFFYTTCGWMMWNWMVSVLALGATLILYDGATNYPDAYRLFELIDKEEATLFGTSAKFLSMVEKNEAIPNTRFKLENLRTILSTGSPLLPKNYDFVLEKIKKEVQVSSISGGTDIVSCFALGNPLLPVYRGELQSIGLGMAVAIFNDEGKAIMEEQGELVCTKAFPSMPIYFWNDPDKKNYTKAYFERFKNVWAHGDFAEITKHQGLIIYGRSDAILNPGGVRIGTAEIYRQVEKFSEIVDSVVIGQNWKEDVRIVLFVKMKDSYKLDETLEASIRQCIKQHASPRHVPAKIVQVEDIPRTISGKTVELAVRQVVHGQPVNNVQSLANPQALEYFKDRKELD